MQTGETARAVCRPAAVLCCVSLVQPLFTGIPTNNDIYEGFLKGLFQRSALTLHCSLLAELYQQHNNHTQVSDPHISPTTRLQ